MEFAGEQVRPSGRDSSWRELGLEFREQGSACVGAGQEVLYNWVCSAGSRSSAGSLEAFSEGFPRKSRPQNSLWGKKSRFT